MSREQKKEMVNIFGKVRGVGELDYVSAWFRKAAEFMRGTGIRAAFVSTNSITQGQQVITLWPPLVGEGLKIDFAHRTFVWSNDARGKAAVHCVIIGFSFAGVKERFIYEGDEKCVAMRINPYLFDAPDVFVESRPRPICRVPLMNFGSMPRDGGGFSLDDVERKELIESEPLAEKWVRPYMGSHEFLNDKPRWCLWLVGADPAEMRKCPKVMRRVRRVKEFRENSKAGATREYADRPTLFCQIAQPDTGYLVVPRVSSERRKYVPLGFMPASVIASDSVFLVPGADMYHFGVLSSILHNIWMRFVCGRLKSDYRYSKDIVYNNFPWPEATLEQKYTISMSARAIISVRNNFKGVSLADLYDPDTMPLELLKVNKVNDSQVMKVYKFPQPDIRSENNYVNLLLEKYINLISAK
jgi:hypothetical protein